LSNLRDIFIIMEEKYKTATGIRKYLGLMFRTRKTESLIFNFNKPVLIPIHSLFVFFKFRAYWFDRDSNLIESRIIKPFQFNIKPSKPFSKLIEVPV